MNAESLQMLQQMSEQDLEKLMKDLETVEKTLQDPTSFDSATSVESMGGRKFTPEPVFVVKTLNLEANTWASKNDKVFLNVCESSQMPSPGPATEEEISDAMCGIDTGYRVPLSISQPRNDRDKSGKSCVVLDACVNSSVLERCKESQRYKEFLIELAISWIEDKCGFILSRDYTVPKMRSKGALVEHIIYPKKKAGINIVASEDRTPSIQAGESLITEALEEPSYNIQSEPAIDPDYLILEVSMPKLKSKSIVSMKAKVEMRPHKIRINVPKTYELDVSLPSLVDMGESGAQFNSEAGMLTITMPVVK